MIGPSQYKSMIGLIQYKSFFGPTQYKPMIVLIQYKSLIGPTQYNTLFLNKVPVQCNFGSQRFWKYILILWYLDTSELVFLKSDLSLPYYLFKNYFFFSLFVSLQLREKWS